MMMMTEFLLWGVILVGCLYSLYLCSLIPNDTFFNGDGSLKALLARQLSQGKLRFDLIETAKPWMQQLWQKGLYAYQAPFVYYLNQRYYVSFPFPFSLLTSVFYKLWNYRGFYFIPLIATWALWLSFYGSNTLASLESWPRFLGLFILIFASPLTLYSAMYWEHTLAVTLGFIGLVLTFLKPEPSHTSYLQQILGGTLVGLSVWFRSECLALVATLALLIFLGMTPQQTFILQWFTEQQPINLINIVIENGKPLVFMAGVIFSVLVLWLCNKLIYHRFLGIHALLILDKFSWSKRIKEALISFQQLNSSFLVYFPISLLPLIYLIIFVWQQVDTAQGERLIFIASIVLFLFAFVTVIFFRGVKKIKSFIKTNLIYLLLFLVASYLLAQVELTITQRMLFLYALYIVYTIGVSCLVDFAPGEVTVGGKQWGPRYLLPMIPFVTVLAVEQVQVLWPSKIPMYGNLALLLTLVSLGVYKNIFQGLQYFKKNHQGIAPAIEFIRRDTNPIVAFSHQYAAQALGFSLRDEKTFFCIENNQQMIIFCQALIEQKLFRCLYVCYPYHPCQCLETKSQYLELENPHQLFGIELNRLGIFGKYPIYDLIITPLNNNIPISYQEKIQKDTSSTNVAPELVCTILPTYNERDNITQLIQRLLNSMPSPYLILVVDDNSPDETWKIVEEIVQKYPISPHEPQFKSGVILKRRIGEKGLTSALQRGIDEAINNYGAKIVTWMDCDLSMPPEDVQKLVKSIQEQQVDLAVGSRWVPGGNDIAHGLMARSLSWIINQMAIIMLGNQVHDYTSGFIAVRSEVLKQIRLEGSYGEYCIDLLCRASRLSYQLSEIPYLCVPRIYGESKTGINLWNYLDKGRDYIATIWRLWWMK